MFKNIFVFAAIAALGAQASSSSNGWNELLRGAELFDEETNLIQDKSNDAFLTVSQLSNILSQDQVLESLYNKYQALFNKDGPKSLSTFKSNLISIAIHNLEAESGKHNWFKGINKFTDMTAQEFENTYAVNVSSWSNFFTEEDYELPTSSLAAFKSAPGAPDALDWTESNAVNSVKDQNRCNSCVMFAFAGQLEAIDALTKRRVSPDLSTQQLLDCAVRNFKCSDPGTNPMDTLNYIKANAVTTWQQYPYGLPPVKQACRAAGKSKQAQADQSGVGQNVDEEQLKEYLATYGPLMVTIFSNSNYNGGIMDNSGCGNQPNHAVLLVGYGTENGRDFWKIKNSYGDKWGEDGYLRLARNAGHTCQIGSYAFIITTKK